MVRRYVFRIDTLQIILSFKEFFSLCDVGSIEVGWYYVHDGWCVADGKLNPILFIYIAICVSEPQLFSCGRVSTYA